MLLENKCLFLFDWDLKSDRKDINDVSISDFDYSSFMDLIKASDHVIYVNQGKRKFKVVHGSDENKIRSY